MLKVRATRRKESSLTHPKPTEGSCLMFEMRTTQTTSQPAQGLRKVHFQLYNAHRQHPVHRKPRGLTFDVRHGPATVTTIQHTQSPHRATAAVIVTRPKSGRGLAFTFPTCSNPAPIHISGICPPPPNTLYEPWVNILQGNFCASLRRRNAQPTARHCLGRKRKTHTSSLASQTL